MTIEDGVYSIASLLDDNQRIDVQWASTAAMAILHLWNTNDTNAQKVLVTTHGGYKRFKALCSGLVWDVMWAEEKSGTTVWQYPENGTVAQDWNIVEKTAEPAVSINGSPQSAVEINSRLNTSLCLDAQWGAKANGTAIWVYERTSVPTGINLAQRWAMHKDSFLDDKLSVPAGVGISLTPTGEGLSSVAIKGTQTLYPAWTGGAGAYQLRYRMRQHKTGSSSWTAWGNWTSPFGLRTDDGWGDAWAATGSDTGNSSTRHHTAGIDFNVEQAVYDKIEAQVEVRRFQANGNAAYGHTHGASATGTVSVVYRPALTFDEVSCSPDGIKVGYASDFARDGNKLTCDIKVGAKTLAANYEASSLPYSGTIDIPCSQLSFIPEDNASATISYKWTTIDTSVTGTEAKSVTYTSGHGSSISASFEPSDGFCEVIDLGQHASAKAWLLLERGDGARFVECESLGEGKFSILPPLGVDYEIYCATTDGSNWATALIKRPAVDGRSQVIWNYEDDWSALRYEMNVDTKTAFDYASQLTSGRDFEVVSFGGSKAKDININAVLAPGLDHGSSSDFERLSGCRFAILRTPFGSWHEVAVLEVSHGQKGPDSADVSVRMKEVSL